MRSYEEVIKYKKVLVYQKFTRPEFSWVGVKIAMDGCIGKVFDVIPDHMVYEILGNDYYEPYERRFTYESGLTPWHAVLLDTRDLCGCTYFFLPESLMPLCVINKQMVF